MTCILITGSNGLLGQTLVNRLLKSNYRIVALSRGENRNINLQGYTYYNIDLTQAEALNNILLKEKPNFIINTAAITNVDYCETHQKECDAVNIDLVKTLIKASEKFKTHLIHISTDFVFDGAVGYYKETDTTNPLNYYGLSKLKSEQLFEKTTIPHTILRTILVFGILPNLKQANILLWLLDKMKNKIPLTMVDDQLRMPTYVEDLASACIAAIELKKQGLYHISGEDMLNMYELALIVAKVFDFNTDTITAIPTEKLHQPAKRPKTTGFNIQKAQKNLFFTPKSFKSALLELKSKV